MDLYWLIYFALALIVVYLILLIIAPYPAEAVVNPTGPQTGEYRIVLGGSFRHWGFQCWQMDGDSPEKKRTHHGFRLAIDNFK